MTATEQLIAKQVSDVFPASVDDLPLADAARRGLIAPLRDLRVPPAAAINSVPIVGGDFEEARAGRSPRPPGAEPGRREPLPRPVRLDAGDRLRRRRRPRLQPRAGVPRRRAEGGGGLRAHAARPAGRDARRVRAGRDQRADQRDAAGGGLELAARDRVHAPRADRLAPRLPAADRPHHAHPPAQGGRHRRRLRAEGRDPRRARGLTPLAARLGLLPRGRAGDAGAPPPPARPRPPEALAGAVARARDTGRARGGSP